MRISDWSSDVCSSDLADLVEEKRAALSKLDLALRGLDRAGKGALFIAEQFGFEQAFGDGGTVDRDEGAAPPVARLMEAAGEKLLAGAAGAQQHYRHGGIGDAFDRAGDLQHFGRGGDNRAEQRRVGTDLALKASVLVTAAVTRKSVVEGKEV